MMKYNHPIFFIEYLTQNVIFHVKSHVIKHEFWELLILKLQHLMLPNLTRNETNGTSLKKSGECKIVQNSDFILFSRRHVRL